MASYKSFKRIATDSLVNNTITAGDLSTGAVTNGKIATDAITADKIATTSIGASQLAASVDLSSKTVVYRSIIDGDLAVGAAIAGSKLAATASTDNLGYTPVNAAGGTMTGALQLVAGSAADPAVRLSTQTNTGIFFPTADTIAFSVAGTERMRINSLGQKTVGTDSNAGSVMFMAMGTSGWTYANSYGGVSAWREIGANFGWDSYQRGGSNFNNSNGRFTAPVTGFYHLTWQTYHYCDDNGTENYHHITFSRNGSTGANNGRTSHGIFGHGVRNNHINGVIRENVLYLEAGQFTSLLHYWASGPSRLHGNHSVFAGSLIG
jgi:hypothetical protein